MTDRFFGQAPGLGALAADNAYTITPRDDIVLSPIPRGIISPDTGTVRVMAMKGTAAVTVPVLAGVLYPIRPRIIYATGTTATSILGVE